MPNLKKLVNSGNAIEQTYCGKMTESILKL